MQLFHAATQRPKHLQMGLLRQWWRMQADPYFTQKEKPPPLLSVQLFHVPQLEGGDKHEALKQAEQKDERGPKKVPQKHAKRWVARTRNRLASVAFASESALLWLDSDLESVHSDMVTAMLRSDKDIAVPIVRWALGLDGTSCGS